MSRTRVKTSGNKRMEVKTSRNRRTRMNKTKVSEHKWKNFKTVLFLIIYAVRSSESGSYQLADSGAPGKAMNFSSPGFREKKGGTDKRAQVRSLENASNLTALADSNNSMSTLMNTKKS